jgi:hypothetical protein
MTTSLLKLAERWIVRRRERRALRLYGGIQWCPWCRQCAQLGDDWYFREWERDTFLDVLTCGICGGLSLWRFEMGMIYVGPLSPPTPKTPAVDFYDIPNACLRARASQGGE